MVEWVTESLKRGKAVDETEFTILPISPAPIAELVQSTTKIEPEEPAPYGIVRQQTTCWDWHTDSISDGSTSTDVSPIKATPTKASFVH